MKKTTKISLIAVSAFALGCGQAEAGFFDFVKKAADSVKHVAEGAVKDVTHSASDVFNFARKTASTIVKEAPKIVKKASPEIEKALKTVGKGALDTGKFLVKNRGVFEHIAEEALKIGAGPACAAAGPVISQAIAVATEGVGEVAAPEVSMVSSKVCNMIASGAQQAISMDPAYKKYQ